MILLSRGIVRSVDKLNPLYLHYHSAYGRQICKIVTYLDGLLCIEFSKLRAFRAYELYVPACLLLLRAYMPSFFMCLRAYVPRYIFFMSTCLCALNYIVHFCAHFSPAYVPTSTHKIY